jgi:hypothetical protein
LRILSPMPFHLLNCRPIFFRDKKVIYWQRGGGSYSLLPRTICGAPGPHFLGITKLFYRKIYWGYYSLLPLYLWNCGVRIFWDTKVIYWQRGGGSYALLPRTICGAPVPHFFRNNKIYSWVVLRILSPNATPCAELQDRIFLG